MFLHLVDELQTASPEFQQWWSSPLVHPLGDGVKTFRIDREDIDYSYSVLTISGNESQRLVVFMPVEEADFTGDARRTV